MAPLAVTLYTYTQLVLPVLRGELLASHLYDSQLAMLPHPGCKLWLLMFNRISKVIALAGGLVEGPVCLRQCT